MKNQAVVATIEFHDNIKLGDAVQSAVYVSDMLECPVKMKQRLGDCQVEIKVEVIGKIESDKSVGSNIRNKCLCKLIKGIHSLDDHGQEGD